jgi:protein tyrosine phosphatase
VATSRFAASSKQQLTTHNVVRVLSVLQPHETSRSLNPAFVTPADTDEGNPAARHQPEIKTLDLDDEPLVDILEHLENACDWIQEGLDGKQQEADRRPPGVLVHCKQGVSRSGAFIVAFRKHSPDFNPFADPKGGFRYVMFVYG